MHRCRLARNRVTERPSREIGGSVRQNRCEILQVGPLRSHSVAAAHKAITVARIMQFVEEGVTPSILFRIQKEIQVQSADLIVGQIERR